MHNLVNMRRGKKGIMVNYVFLTTNSEALLVVG